MAWFADPEEVIWCPGCFGRWLAGWLGPRWLQVCVGDCQAPPLPGMAEGGQCTPGQRTNTIEIQNKHKEIKLILECCNSPPMQHHQSL